jgi:signal transduction histidine kinase
MKGKTADSATILIVDDLVENIEVLGTLIRKNKYKVAVAMNGEDAIKVTKKILPDLILLDIAMPGKDGFSVCKTLKSDPLTESIPIIFLTAKVESEDVVAGFSIGAVDYITKPFKSAELLMRIKTHLTIKNLQNELRLANETLENKVIERTRELEKAKEKAELSDNIKSEFLSQISHEIRTPLNAVISSAGLIETEMEEKIDDYLKPIFESLKKGSHRIIRTVDLILNMAQLHTNSYELKNEKIDVAELLLLTAAKYKAPAKEKSLALNINCLIKDAFVTADYYAVEEIFGQLLDNAVNFTPKGSITVSMQETEKEYIAAIQDTGVGISDDYLTHLFTIFSQEEGGYTRKFEGNGLGLALTKKYCSLIHASIAVESKKDKGSKFSVTFNKYKI